MSNKQYVSFIFLIIIFFNTKFRNGKFLGEEESTYKKLLSNILLVSSKKKRFKFDAHG